MWIEPECKVVCIVSLPELYLYSKFEDRERSAEYSSFPCLLKEIFSFDRSSTIAIAPLKFLVLTCCFSKVIPADPVSE